MDMALGALLFAARAATPTTATLVGLGSNFDPAPIPEVTGNLLADLALNTVPILRIGAGIGRTGAALAAGDQYGAGRAIVPPAVEIGAIAVGAALGAGPRTAAGVSAGGESGFPSGPMQVVRTIEHGEKIANIISEAKMLTFSTGNEHALVKLATGERALVSGGPGGITWDLGQVSRVFGHTHPYELPPTGPSASDFAALDALGQRSSWLLEHGLLTRFGKGH